MSQRRGVAVVGVVGAVVLLVGGCGGGAAKKGAGGSKPAAAASAPASASASAPPVMPAVVGQKFADAEALVRQVVSTPVQARGAKAGGVVAPEHGQWEVCSQNPAAGAAVTTGTAVELSLAAPGTSCPAAPGASSKPSAAPKSPSTPPPAPAPTRPKPATEGPTDGSTGGSGAGGSVYYKNCDAAKAAGAAPIRRGQPGYRDALDRDKDGIACDK
ncbi:excalibur calcium-binding domain-containing protein [Streptomyces sp. WAC07149]|uniref:excalibur calcium-binding domain-containing protein n=1 Tax=Streptomyces sp. WAC07149 TaxID=2487425 RepID=UPI0021AF1FC0|nr:excalibur calcium-binding domain-containing protein [Streptomyces sp. WAC07149]